MSVTLMKLTTTIVARSIDVTDMLNIYPLNMTFSRQSLRCMGWVGGMLNIALFFYPFSFLSFWL